MAGTRAAATPGRRGDPAPDPLRRDVRLLTTLLGDAIRAHDGEEAFGTVERLRRAVIALHERPTPSRAASARRLVAALDREEGARVARAFTAFFQLVNVAEDRQRVRDLRTGGAARTPAPLERPVELTEVLTAHPTEAKRRAVVEHLWRIGDTLDALDDPRCAGRVRADLHRRLAEDVAALWLTDPVRRDAPTPLDEVRAVLALFDRTIFTTLPKVLRSTGSGARIRWATWVGGDRDGNPLVTAAVTTEAVAIARDHVLRGYETAARRIARALSVSETDVPAAPALRRSLARDAAAFPVRARELARTLPDAPHRRKLVLVAERLAATREGRGGAYEGPAAFGRDLEALRASLRAGGAPVLADGDLAHLAWQAETFGFHLASMEIRQHSDVLRAAVRTPDAEVDATFAAVAALQASLGEEACHRVIVSFTRGAQDVAAVYALARRADPALPRHLDVVPLFESGAELARATSILDDIANLPTEKARLRRNGGRMEVMVGYSDSAKEAGVLAASLALYEAQRRIAAWGWERGIDVTLFHGRGGALGRGGGPTARAIVAQPPGSVGGRFKVTEQGEVAFARYGDPDVAWHHLEQMVRAVAAAPGPEVPDPSGAFSREIATMRAASEAAWRSLVTTPGFARCFTAATPIRQIASLPIASRPVSRTATVEDLDALRAIPWVFSWSQARVNLPGWFGLGSGLEAVAATRGGLARLRRLHRAWPFFGVVLENAEMSLAKADRALAARYLARAERPDIVAAIEEEWDRTERLLLAVTGHGHLLEGRPWLRDTIALRAPYVDALSYLQLRFLDDPAATRVVQATIGGLAAGLQNTG
jgi:phosphoenolpyruvate carboxylase